MNFLIHNTAIFTNNTSNTVLHGDAIAVQDSHIAAIGQADALRAKFQFDRELDGRGKLLMPGLVNTHMHFYGTFARGINITDSPTNFHEVLQMLWWKLDRALDDEGVYYSTLIPAITAVKHGVTAIIDHHASPNAVDGSLDMIEEAMSAVGLRGILCYEVSNRDGGESAKSGIAENERYIRKCQNAKTNDSTHRFDAMMGLHASFTIDDATMEQAAGIASDLGHGCHIHLLEDEVDRRLTTLRYRESIVERLSKFGVLGEKTIAAHGIFLTEAEIAQIAASKTMVVHNPQSNMNNAVGRAPIFELLDAGLMLGLGTDGMSASVWPDARTANLLHKHDLQNSTVGWAEIQQIVLKNNPQIYRQLSGQQVGVIEEGAMADIILVEYHAATPLTPENIWGHFLFGIADARVDTTIINGKIIMENGVIDGIDEAEIAAKSCECAQQTWDRFSKLD